jgi:APA family basic amino acid/polyamine antiporter
MAAAAIIFFAFYGFDAIATAAEEAKNPSRDLAIGIVGSMVLCVIIYMVVAAAAIGAVATTGFANSAEPLALILREIGQPWAARVLGASAVIALPTVILAFFYGQSRIFFTVARDGLLPSSLARVSSRGTPVRITIFTAVVTSVFAGLIPLTAIAALANAGTLAAFVAVCAAMLVMRRREPNRERRFRAPAAWFVGIFGILGCLYLFISLPTRTQLFFLYAQVIGVVLYFIYGHGAAARARESGAA